ncbi:MAG: transcription elongation factor Spt5 [Candidatus Rehaiarchaeum fermentans]|nr:transcription elongation factor Spt5 [Candidatus Rehaiarchaeum fermentans]
MAEDDQNKETQIEIKVIKVISNKEKKFLEILRNSEVPTSLISVTYTPKLKGYMIIETDNPEELYEFFKGIKYFRGFSNIELSDQDIEKILKKEEKSLELKIGDLVRVISGPFKGEIVSVKGVDNEKKEIIVSFIQSSVPIQVNIKMSDVELVKKEEYESNVKSNS